MIEVIAIIMGLLSNYLFDWMLAAILGLLVCGGVFLLSPIGKQSLVAGGGTFLLVGSCLSGIGYLLNVPLGPPLALPSDYVMFWLVVGIVIYLLYLAAQVPTWIILWLLWKEGK